MASPIELGAGDYRRFFDVASELLMVFDRQGRLLKVNKAFEDKLGYTQKEAESKPFTFFVHPDDQESTFERFEKLLNQETDEGFINRYRTKSGTYIWLEWRVVILPEVQFCSARDITEQIEVRNKIYASEKRFHETLDNLLEGCMIIGFDWKYLYVNDAAASHGLAKKEDLTGSKITEKYPGIEQTEVFSYFSRCMEKRVPQYFRTSLEFPGKGTRWYDISVEPSPEGIFVLSQNITKGKEAENRLKSSEEKYRVMFATNPLPSWIYDVETFAFLEVNLAAMEHYGYTEEEFHSLTVKDIHPPEDVPAFVYEAAQPIQDGRRSTWRHKKKDGETITVEVTASSVEYNGRPARQVMVNDITEMKKKEYELQKSEENYRTLTENSIDMIMRFDSSFRNLYVSPSAAAFLGRRIEDFIGKTHHELGFPEAEYSYWEAEMSKVFESGKPSRMVTPINNGEIFVDWSIIPEFDYGGAVSTVLSISRDVTEIEKAKLQLREQEEYYRRLFEDHDAVQFIIDPSDGHIVDANNSAASYYGWPREQLRKMSISDINVMPAAQMQATKEKVISGERTHLELKHRLADGSVRDVEVLVSNVTISGKQFIQPVIIDVTERKKSQAIIKEQMEELRRVNTEKDKFFSIIAHDLKSPFHTFFGLMEVLAEDIEAFPLPKLQSFMRNLNRSGKNLYTLLENLLQWSRMQRGEMPFEPEFQNVFNTVKLSVDAVHLIAEQKEITINVTEPYQLNIYADKNMVNAIVRNLLSNAIKFTNRGGGIAVTVDETKDSFVEIAVVDSGVGMSPETVSKLFKINEKVNTEGTEKEPSSGLGLILCKEFVEKNGGKIWVESEKGKGSAFRFTLPTAK